MKVHVDMNKIINTDSFRIYLRVFHKRKKKHPNLNSTERKEKMRAIYLYIFLNVFCCKVYGNNLFKKVIKTKNKRR